MYQAWLRDCGRSETGVRSQNAHSSLVAHTREKCFSDDSDLSVVRRWKLGRPPSASVSNLHMNHVWDPLE
ncbi:hypothetical protein L210DRAFT_945754 [Boletus edulis BED1]|uniref:Uncharacterized protein n=1 Tax=Boletus edulis BED1 TaxID=1328754 RepID=A0AAD4BBF2_BOLED|nr:hypothetical protein L210DRAFT_945754 [Boletus edulis BED1]